MLGCAGGPIAKNYPTKKIDQPYVIPQGMKSWTAGFRYGEAEMPGDHDWNIGGPFYFESALSTNWSLLYTPIPLGVRYQIAHDEKSTAGVTAGSSIGYSSYSKWLFGPIVEVSYRRNICDDKAVFMKAEQSRTIRSEPGSGPKERLTSKVEVGSIYQFNEKQYAGISLNNLWTRNDAASVGHYQVGQWEGGVREYMTRHFLFVGPLYGIRFSQQWELNAAYQHLVHHSDHFLDYEWQASATVTNFW
jgi:hypothetical protein